jgi:hypothetical protein
MSKYVGWRFNMNRLVVASIAFLSLIPIASADISKGHGAFQDQVILNLTTEGWVKTDTAKVSVFVDLVQQTETPEELKTRIDASLSSLAKDTEWRFTSSNQRLDQTGLNRWYVTAEARVHESALSGIQDRAKTASSPGYKVGVSYVDFTPSLAEFEMLRSDLRSEIYEQAVAEANRLNKAIPGNAYHVKRVDFVQQQGPVPRMEAARAQTMMVKSQGADSAAGGGAQLLVSVKQAVTAHVILARSAEMPEK